MMVGEAEAIFRRAQRILSIGVEGDQRTARWWLCGADLRQERVRSMVVLSTWRDETFSIFRRRA